MDKKFYLYANGEKVEVSEEVYRTYWRSLEHEKYLKKLDIKNNLIVFSGIDLDGNFINNLEDKKVDIENIMETTLKIEALRSALSKLSNEEREIIERIYFNDEKLCDIANDKSVSYQTVQKKRNKILVKLKKLLEEIF